MAGSPPSPPSPSRATLLTSALSLFVSAAGAGLLSYPFAVMHQGIAVNLLLTLLFALLNVFSDLVIVQSASLFAPHLTKGTFEELALRALGKGHYVASVLAIVLGIFGALIGFMIVIGDMLVPVAERICEEAGGGAQGDGPCLVLASRWFLVLAVAFLVALPLSARPSLHSLFASSALAALTVLAVGVLVVAKGAAAIGGGDPVTTSSAPDAGLPDAGATGPGSRLVLARWQFVSWMLGIPISIFSLGNHTQIVPVVHDLPWAARRRFHLPVFAAVGACFVLYSLTGVFGYAAFRDTTKGDVLVNFPASDAASDTAKALLGIHVLLAYPVLLWPCRKCVTALLELFVAGKRGGEAVKRVTGLLSRYPLAQSAVLVGTSSVLSVAFPQVAVVFGLVGATAATYQIYCYPAALLLRWADALEGKAAARARDDGGVGAKGGRDESAALLDDEGNEEEEEKGVDQGPYGRWTEADRNRVWASSEELRGKEDEEGETGKARGSRRGGPFTSYLSTSPPVLRAQAYGLLSIFATVTAIGTGTYVYSTWIEG
jgi:amino acid permease